MKEEVEQGQRDREVYVWKEKNKLKNKVKKRNEINGRLKVTILKN